MDIAIALVIITLILATAGTLALTIKTDENYKTATKQNTLRLTAIYIFVILFALIGLGWYITHL